MQGHGSNHNLPAQLTSFIGREQDLAELGWLLRSSRLVTLTGAGGVGKSRLALQLASRLTDELTDGVWLVELAAVADPALVSRAVASALAANEQAGRDLIDTLVEGLAARSTLLVLDNCEHLIDACAALTERLLRACPCLRILATSREALGITGETSWRVRSLALPEQDGAAGADRPLDSEAVRLFAERAAAVSPGFRVTEQTADAVAQVCGRLDGIPLAIELAAARVKLLNVDQIAARLDDRFRLLTGGSRTALPRHQTLRATIDWSYALLSEQERIVLRRLAVFSSGWTLEAAEAVCAGEAVGPEDVLELLSRLVDKSLVQVEGGLVGEPRYRFLETLRQYAQDRLLEAGETAAIRERHLDWCLTLVESAEALVIADVGMALPFDARRRERIQRLNAEHDNLRAALAWSQAGPSDASKLARLTIGLRSFWYVQGNVFEGRHWHDRALGASEHLPPELRAGVFYGAGLMARLQDDYERAAPLLERTVQLCRALRFSIGLAVTLGLLGEIRRNQGRFDEAMALDEEMLRELPREEPYFSPNPGKYRLGALAWYMNDLASAQRHLEESLAGMQSTGSSVGWPLTLAWLGRTHYSRGDLDRAGALLEEGLALGREMSSWRAVSYSLHHLGLVERARGDPARAIKTVQEALVLRRDSGDREGIAFSLEALAGLALTGGEAARAARLLGAAEALREAIGAPLPPVVRAEYEADLAALRAALPEEALAAAWDSGRIVPLDRAIAEGLALSPPSAGAAGPRPRPVASPISPREREVAALVARGLMNREIAAELVIAERTVETHVANILGKLGLKSRAQVGAWAARHGLLDGQSA
jgi:non-specific serine/threonine protein kinase